MRAIKPPYVVPTMREVEATPKALSAVSTFSGAGGSCLGLKLAGFRVLWANEFVPAAQETYRANHPGTYLDTRDIREISARDIREVIGDVEVDLLEGSPPCAAFSIAGRGARAWGEVRAYSETRQRVDDLFYEFARLLRELRPRAFVAENVAGLARGAAKGFFVDILKALREAGYRVEARLLDACRLDVPQARRRLFFVGVREDVGASPAFPAPLPYVRTLRDAMPWLPASSPHPVEDEAWLGDHAIGRYWDETLVGARHKKRFNLVRPALDRPCSTVTQTMGDARGRVKYAANVTHPFERRYLSIYELKRVFSFPDDFVLTGTYAQQWERLGRSVPPLMMYHVASAMREVLCPSNAT